MNWTKAILAGVVGGIVKNLVDWGMHGGIMGDTYTKYEVFGAEPANPMHFFLTAICIGIFAALLFARTRDSWGDGLMGGVSFGVWTGMMVFFGNFYNALVIKGFPYYMSWCWGGMEFIGMVVLGAVLGLMYKKA